MAENQVEHFPNTQLKRYVDILLDRGVPRGVIGPREQERIWDRHIFNSLAVTELIPAAAEIADIGSGAGLPGIPLALAREDLTVVLVEPMLRRTRFLDEVIQELGLSDRVEVVRGRAEGHDRTYDAVVARALAPLAKLLTWCAPLVRPDGVILALKGSSAEAELEQATHTLAQHHLYAEKLEMRARPSGELTRVIRAWHRPEPT